MGDTISNHQIVLTFAFAIFIGLIKLTEILKVNTHVHDVEVPDKVENVDEKEVFDAFRKQMAENKPKKGKGKKGGKKKKKKS